MAPGHLTWTQCGLGCVHLDAGHLHRAPHLVMVRLSALGGNALKALHRCEIHGTNVGGPRITNAPPLPLHPP
jgi:hypothetical protein